MCISYCRNKLFLLLFFLSAASGAEAHHCYIQTPNIDFGKVDPLRIEGTTAAAVIKLNCWSVTSPTHYCLTVKDDVPERFLKSGKYEIPFNFYYDNVIFGSGGYGKPIIGTIEPIKWKPTQYPEIRFSAKLGRPGGLDLGTGIYSGNFRTVVYGAYGRASLTDAEKQSMCEGKRPPGLVVFTELSQTFSVHAKIERSCSIVVTNINFGKARDLNSVKDAEGAVRVKCSSPTNYEIGLNMGQHDQGNGLRAMQCADPSTCKLAMIRYNFYRKEGNNRYVWNDNWKTDGVANGFSNNQTILTPVYAEINPADKLHTPPAGIYSDTVIAEVRW